MTTQLPSKERLEKIANMIDLAGPEHVLGFAAGEVSAIAAALLAGMEQEPVAVVELSDYVTAAQLSGDEPRKKAVKELYEGALVVGQNLYAHPAPSIPAVPDYYVVVTTANVWQTFCKTRAEADFIVSKPFHKGYYVLEVYTRRAAMLHADHRETIRSQHAEWSQVTFGNVGPVGPLKHLSKEALEAAAEPDDLSEWADMQFLLWDAQRRAGITDEQINQAMLEKLAVNKAREWPEPKDGEPRLHIQSAPKVTP